MFHLSCGVTLSHWRPQKKKTEIPNASSKALRRWGRWRGCVFMRTCANHWPLLQRCSCLEWLGVDHLLRKLVQLCKIGWCLWKALPRFGYPKYSPRSFCLSDFPAPNQPLWGEIWMVLGSPCPNFHPGHFRFAIHPGLVAPGLLYDPWHDWCILVPPMLAGWDEANIIWMAS